MLSLRRWMYVAFMVVTVSSIFIIYNINQERTRNIQIENTHINDTAAEENFIKKMPIEEADLPSVRIYGDDTKVIYQDIYRNVRQVFQNLHFRVTSGTETEDAFDIKELVVFCDDSVGKYVDLAQLGDFISDGGKVLFAAGLPEGNEDAYLWSILGIREKSIRENDNRLRFEEPLFPIQTDELIYDGFSASTWLSLRGDAKVYIRSADSKVPILHTMAYGAGKSCLINGTFLADPRCSGLLTGAVGTLWDDFIYPVMGTKTVFLDNFPMITYLNDKLCMQLYGCSTEAFVRDVVWRDFLGMSLRTDTVYTSGILTAAALAERFPQINDSLFAAIGKSALQYGGELIYETDCDSQSGIFVNQVFLDAFLETFPAYQINGLAVLSDDFSQEMLQLPGHDNIRMVRGKLKWENAGFQGDEAEAYTMFPAATYGSQMEEGNLFAVYSVLASYGMLSHVFDIHEMVARDEETASWERDKKQLGIFEEKVLKQLWWLDKATLSQTELPVRSYLGLSYGWRRSGDTIFLDCSNMVRGQAFLFKTKDRIQGAKGLHYEEIGNGYYLLRVQENNAVITMEGV